MSQNPVIFWFRQDLRLTDNPGLAAAIRHGAPVIPVYILDDEGEGDWPLGGASRWWLHHSLESLGQSIKKKGGGLVLRHGPSLDILRGIIHQSRATGVFWNRRYEPDIIKRDTRIKSQLQSDGLEVHSFNGALLFEPWEIENKSGSPFKVFTPFWRHCSSLTPDRYELHPAPPTDGDHWAPASLLSQLKGQSLQSLELLPDIRWDSGFPERWTPGESGAMDNLKQFVDGAFENYGAGRDFPAQRGTSRLSPHLHFGEISPRQIWNFLASRSPDSRWRQSQYVSEIGWREFANHLLYHFPTTPRKPLREEFEAFPWQDDEDQYKAWCGGRTGYPIVDAGMRELWTTGWMHNRVRMIVASFLVKHLLTSWNRGAAWFWDTLVDADLASNTLGWQWAAGCGADAAPYFRIFNPILQGEKFDPDGTYVRHWVPEIRPIPTKYIHKPWETPDSIQKHHGVIIGGDYPAPIVDHREGRQAALEAFETIKK